MAPRAWKGQAILKAAVKVGPFLFVFSPLPLPPDSQDKLCLWNRISCPEGAPMSESCECSPPPGRTYPCECGPPPPPYSPSTFVTYPCSPPPPCTVVAVAPMIASRSHILPSLPSRVVIACINFLPSSPSHVVIANRSHILPSSPSRP